MAPGAERRIDVDELAEYFGKDQMVELGGEIRPR